MRRKETLEDMKESVLSFFREHPRNYGRAAKEFGFPRDEIISFAVKYSEEFREVEESYLDEIEEKIFRCANGDDTLEDFSVGQAMKVLSTQRPGKWSLKYVTPDEGNRKDKGRARAQELAGKLIHPPSSVGGDVSSDDDGKIG